jgi:hypothetical protein
MLGRGGRYTMTEREKEPITRPSDPQLMSNPADLAITIVAIAVMLLLRYQ